jgi:histidinol-phosphate/aromatic aminotransferase/cobyric acid decarboxylase-like protein
LPEYIRIGIRSMDDNRRLAEALRRVLAERGMIA